MREKGAHRANFDIVYKISGGGKVIEHGKLSGGSCITKNNEADE